MKSIITEINKRYEIVCFHQNINDHEIIECPIFNNEIKPYCESRYNGRVTCDVGEIKWAKS